MSEIKNRSWDKFSLINLSRQTKEAAMMPEYAQKVRTELLNKWEFINQRHL